MTNPTTKREAAQPEAEEAVSLFADWFDPIESGLAGSGSRVSSRR